MKKFKSKVLCMFVSSLVFSSGLLALTSDSFVIGVKTDNPGISADNKFTIPTYSGSTYNYSVDCDHDGSYEATGVDGNYTCSFPIGGTFTRTIIIDGTFPRIYFNNEGDVGKLTTVEQWGTQQWESMRDAFFGAFNLEYVPNTPSPNLSQINQSLYGMFYNADKFNQPVGNWNVSNIVNMTYMFYEADIFNQDIGDWNVSNVKYMYAMFGSADAFNQNIGNWNVSNVRDMSGMFTHAYEFNQDIGNWDVSNVINMSSMFRYATGFSQDLASWDVSKVSRMDEMFIDANLSISDYDHMLQEWSKLTLQNDVTFDLGSIQYCNGLRAKNSIISQYSWTINDGGSNCDFYIDTPFNITVPSGVTQKIALLSAHNIGIDSVTYSVVGGSDASKFALSISKGKTSLYMGTVDAKNPTDSNKNNIYRVRIRAESGSYSDERTISVKVSNNSILVPIINYLLQ